MDLGLCVKLALPPQPCPIIIPLVLHGYSPRDIGRDLGEPVVATQRSRNDFLVALVSH